MTNFENDSGMTFLGLDTMFRGKRRQDDPLLSFTNRPAVGNTTIPNRLYLASSYPPMEIPATMG